MHRIITFATYTSYIKIKVKMGNITQAVCQCGLESEAIFQGIGFSYYENGNRTEPAYCDTCGIVVGKDMSKHYAKCPSCRKKMKFYQEEDIDTPMELVSGDYLQEKESWYCPRCKKQTLHFESMGCWD